jgi:hypothetical protein
MAWSKRTVLLAALTLTATLVIGGCSSKKKDPTPDKLTIKDVRGKTPGLYSISQSKGQLKNTEASAVNSWRRGLRTDINHIFLLNRNTRLTETTLP